VKYSIYGRTLHYHPTRRTTCSGYHLFLFFKNLSKKFGSQVGFIVITVQTKGTPVIVVIEGHIIESLST